VWRCLFRYESRYCSLYNIVWSVECGVLKKEWNYEKMRKHQFDEVDCVAIDVLHPLKIATSIMWTSRWFFIMAATHKTDLRGRTNFEFRHHPSSIIHHSPFSIIHYLFIKSRINIFPILSQFNSDCWRRIETRPKQQELPRSNTSSNWKYCHRNWLRYTNWSDHNTFLSTYLPTNLPQ